MAGPIKISVVADVGQAIKNVTKFRDITEDSTHRVVTGLGDPKMTGGFGKMQEGFDVLDTRAMGFRDTVTGVQDSIAGFSALMGKGEHATDSMYDKLVLAGMGVGDLASGFANFIVPMAAVATSLNALSLASIKSTASLVAQKVAMVAGTVATAAATVAQWALNVALSANPIGIIIIAIIALVAAIVLLWKKNETFRNVVTAAWNVVWGTIKAVWNWIRTNFPKVYHWVVDPIVNAVKWAINKFNELNATVRAIPGKIKDAFGNANRILYDIGKKIVQGLINGVKSQFTAVKNTLGNLTSNLTSWKGPESKDRKLLAGTGRMIMSGFRRGLESEYGGIRDSLGGFTDSLTRGSAGSVSVKSAGTPTWAARLISLLEGGLTLSLESDGSTTANALLELLEDLIRVRGGSGRVIGITKLT